MTGSYLRTCLLLAFGVHVQSAANALVIDTFLHDDSVMTAGTESRPEYESKLAFATDTSFSARDLTDKIYSRLSSMIAEGAFAFPKLVREPGYRMDSFETFAFKDYYFDTDDLDVYQMNSAYRLRYRWTRLGLYFRHQILPFLRAFYPSRCEIQLKANYQPGENDLMRAAETRFEFRNESSPFDIDKDAPLAPWPVEDFTKYAATGIYESYRMLPTQTLAQMIRDQLKKTSFDLKPRLTLLSARRRSHFDIANPWGSGPNPDQAFIITFDTVYLEDAQAPFRKEGANGFVMLEVEVEIDRSTLTDLYRVVDWPEYTTRDRELVRSTATAYSKQALKALEGDLQTVKNAIRDVIQSEYGLKSLPLSFKYKRYVDLLNSGSS